MFLKMHRRLLRVLGLCLPLQLALEIWDCISFGVTV